MTDKELIDKLEKEITRINHFLFGIDGNNGMRSEIKSLEQELELNTKRLESMEKSLAKWVGGAIAISIIVEIGGLIFNIFAGK